MRAAPLLLTAALTATALGALPAAASAKAPARPHDFNGDGRTDLVVNAPESVRKGQIGPGLVAVLYGGTHREQVITRYSRGVSAVADHGDGFGESTASADFDKDGYADLAVTGPEEDGVTVVYGSKKGLSGRVAFLPTPGASPAQSGGSLAAGDLDRDGRADLVATVRDRYWVFSGVGGGRPRSAAADSLVQERGLRPAQLTPLIADFTGDGRPDLVLGATLNGESVLLRGSSAGLTAPVPIPGLATALRLAAGDLDGDGRADLVTAASGRVQIRLGGPSGLGKPKTLTGRTPGVPLGGSPSTFGASLAVGDVNRDGRDDLAIGASYAGAKNSGQVVLLRGHRGGVTTERSQVFSQKNKGLKASPERGDDFGLAVRVVDVSGDRRPELVIGSPNEDGNTGRFYVLANEKGRITARGAERYRPKDFGLGGFRFGSLFRP